ncbi:hypothetical protein TthAA220_13350 [Thermus thermophilus]|nr:BMP family ABC transporter substrate-binding protein [Thermus thermophilus]BBL82551.1 hypothetical protein TthAA220_13350 [Thermus thermophilus]
MRRLVLGVLAALGLALGQGDKLKACFIYVGPVGDAGWTYAHDVGRKKAEAALPWLETRYVESVPEAQVVPVIDRFVREGCRVIFATSFGYMDGVLEAAKKYPDVIFAHATGIKRAPNVATYMADFYQVYYLNGLAAGALTKTGKVGYVAAFPIPEVKRHINAFALGVRAVRPDAQVLVRWINAWYDPAKAREATEALLAQGADVFAFTEDTPTVIQTAARKGAYSFGHYTPMLKFAPDHVVSGQIVHWEVTQNLHLPHTPHKPSPPPPGGPRPRAWSSRRMTCTTSSGKRTRAAPSLASRQLPFPSTPTQWASR